MVFCSDPYDLHELLASIDEASRSEALETLGERPPLGMIAFDCIARRGVLGDPGITTEIQRVAQHAGGAPVAGFYTYGGVRTPGVGLGLYIAGRVARSVDGRIDVDSMGGRVRFTLHVPVVELAPESLEARVATASAPAGSPPH